MYHLQVRKYIFDYFDKCLWGNFPLSETDKQPTNQLLYIQFVDAILANKITFTSAAGGQC